MAVRKRTRSMKKGRSRKTVFESEVYVNGVRVDYRVFDTRAEAEVWHDKRKQEFEVGANQALRREDDLTFHDCVKRYESEATPLLLKLSQQSRAVRLRYFYDAPIAQVKMKDFTAHTIDQWFSWLYRHPTRNNPIRRDFRHELRLLSIVLNWYRNYYDASFNIPIVARHRERCFFKIVPPRRPDFFICREDVISWLEVLKTNCVNPVYYRLAKFMILTGVRIGEAAGIFWDAVDLEHRVVRIIRTVAWDHLLATRDLSAVQANMGHRTRAITEKYAKVVALLDSSAVDKTAAFIALPDFKNHGQNHGQIFEEVVLDQKF